jgi:AsmA family protein
VQLWAMKRLVYRGLAVALACVVALIGIAAMLAAATDAGYFRGLLVRYIAAHSGRQILVKGPLHTNFFTRHPWFVAEQVTIRNPPWMPAGITAEIGRVSLTFAWPWVDHSFGIERLVIETARLHLERDVRGHANWQLSDPDKGDQGGVPLIRNLSMSKARVDLHDDLRHLMFDGIVSAQDVHTARGLPPFRIAGEGDLNGRPATFEITADPLATASHDKTFAFSYEERSGNSRIIGRGFLLRAFDFNSLDTRFDATGANLKDLYFLTGVRLVNTGRFHLSGKLSRRGKHSAFTDLAMNSGQSDVHGTLSIDSSGVRPKLDADLKSQVLRTSDIGERAAAGNSEPDPQSPLLLSNTPLNPSTLRRDDAVMNYHARRVDIGHLPMHSVALVLTINHGVMVAAPLSAEVSEGKLTGRVKLDATSDNPAADVDLTLSNLHLGSLPYKHPDAPPLEGILEARVAVTGHGSSVHQVAATANGKVTAIIPRGSIRASLAELTSINLRAMRLFLTKNPQEAVIRCAVARIRAENGKLTANTMIIDTDTIMIEGQGSIQLDSEALDLEFRGQPKGLRFLELQAPVLVSGTLAKPSFKIEPGHSPLKLIDRGVKKDADCGSLVTSAEP